jgi:hypothetical protein
VDLNGVKLWASQKVQVKGRDLDDVKIQLASPFSIPGRVVMEVPEGMPAPKPPGVVLDYADAVQFDARPPGNGVTGGNVDAKGNIIFKNVYPGYYQIVPTPVPAPYYLDSIRLGAREAFQPDVQILSGAEPITVTYQLHGEPFAERLKGADWARSG